jgi:hypothetical protein
LTERLAGVAANVNWPCAADCTVRTTVVVCVSDEFAVSVPVIVSV